jgi:hypothetical protein
VVPLRNAEVKPSRSVHRPEEFAGLFLSIVEFPECRFRCARQNDLRAGATGAANFGVARDAVRTAGKTLFRDVEFVKEGPT